MFFGIPKERFDTLAPEVRVFLALAHGFVNQVPIVRSDIRDKEFPLQNWVQRRIHTAGLSFEPPGRLKYPDFLLMGHACGFEVKGLSVPGRWVDFDCNSQLPLAEHGGRRVFYIFGRVPQGCWRERVSGVRPGALRREFPEHRDVQRQQEPELPRGWILWGHQGEGPQDVRLQDTILIGHGHCPPDHAHLGGEPRQPARYPYPGRRT